MQLLSWRLLLTLISSAIPFATARAVTGPEPMTPNAIAQELRSFGELGSVLYVAAHPDDENTQLIAYLARGRAYRTAYLSLTRGDGGQNVLGSDFGEKLGVARTHELLAARELDGGRQFFTRALDFGFSKDYQETLRLWDKQLVLSDIVRVIRTFRPDVLVTRFSPLPGGTHGHHTASAVLALEAFKLAGDPKAFPEQLGELTPWQPKRILWNGGPGRPGSPPATQSADILRLEFGGNDPVLGLSFAELASRSRSMHKTQGFGNFGAAAGGSGMRTETFQLLAGEPASKDIMDGVETTWKRVPGGEAIASLAEEALAHFDPKDPAASVPALLQLRGRVAALPKDPLVSEKCLQLDRVVQACLGLTVVTTLPQAEVVPGEALKLHHSALVRSRVPVRWLAVRYPANKGELSAPIAMQSGEASMRDTTQRLSPDTPLTQPYWLREDATPGMFRVADASMIGRAENPPIFPVEHIFEVGGQQLVVADEPLQAGNEANKPELRRHLDVISPVSLHFVSEVQLFAPNTAQTVEVEITAARAGLSGSIHLNAPVGWKVEPATRPFRFMDSGEHARVSFKISAPAQSLTAKIGATAEIAGTLYHTERVEVRYAHLPLQLLQPAAQLRAVSLELAKLGQKIGYVPGAGDSVEDNLRQVGYTVTELTGHDLTAEKLKEFDAVVFGVRAFNVRTDLGPQLATLFAYVENGGTVIAQYNRPDGLKTDKLAPFDLRLSQERVTDEDATVTFLAPEHPVLNVPNKITQADFNGWVQERGLYFPNHWDEHFVPILACGDAGETPLKGGLLVASYGHGYFIYTGLAFFRQLPAGVPGAYRLFANLVSIGK